MRATHLNDVVRAVTTTCISIHKSNSADCNNKHIVSVCTAVHGSVPAKTSPSSAFMLFVLMQMKSPWQCVCSPEPMKFSIENVTCNMAAATRTCIPRAIIASVSSNSAMTPCPATRAKSAARRLQQSHYAMRTEMRCVVPVLVHDRGVSMVREQQPH